MTALQDTASPSFQSSQPALMTGTPNTADSASTNFVGGQNPASSETGPTHAIFSAISRNIANSATQPSPDGASPGFTSGQAAISRSFQDIASSDQGPAPGLLIPTGNPMTSQDVHVSSDGLSPVTGSAVPVNSLIPAVPEVRSIQSTTITGPSSITSPGIGLTSDTVSPQTRSPGAAPAASVSITGGGSPATGPSQASSFTLSASSASSPRSLPTFSQGSLNSQGSPLSLALNSEDNTKAQHTQATSEALSNSLSPFRPGASISMTAPSAQAAGAYLTPPGPPKIPASSHDNDNPPRSISGNAQPITNPKSSDMGSQFTPAPPLSGLNVPQSSGKPFSTPHILSNSLSSDDQSATNTFQSTYVKTLASELSNVDSASGTPQVTPATSKAARSMTHIAASGSANELEVLSESGLSMPHGESSSPMPPALTVGPAASDTPASISFQRVGNPSTRNYSPKTTMESKMRSKSFNVGGDSTFARSIVPSKASLPGGISSSTDLLTAMKTPSLQEGSSSTSRSGQRPAPNLRPNTSRSGPSPNRSADGETAASPNAQSEASIGPLSRSAESASERYAADLQSEVSAQTGSSASQRSFVPSTKSETNDGSGVQFTNPGTASGAGLDPAKSDEPTESGFTTRPKSQNLGNRVSSSLGIASGQNPGPRVNVTAGPRPTVSGQKKGNIDAEESRSSQDVPVSASNTIVVETKRESNHPTSRPKGSNGTSLNGQRNQSSPSNTGITSTAPQGSNTATNSRVASSAGGFPNVRQSSPAQPNKDPGIGPNSDRNPSEGSKGGSSARKSQGSNAGGQQQGGSSTTGDVGAGPASQSQKADADGSQVSGGTRSQSGRSNSNTSKAGSESQIPSADTNGSQNSDAIGSQPEVGAHGSSNGTSQSHSPDTGIGRSSQTNTAGSQSGGSTNGSFTGGSTSQSSGTDTDRSKELEKAGSQSENAVAGSSQPKTKSPSPKASTIKPGSAESEPGATAGGSPDRNKANVGNNGAQDFSSPNTQSMEFNGEASDKGTATRAQVTSLESPKNFAIGASRPAVSTAEGSTKLSSSPNQKSSASGESGTGSSTVEKVEGQNSQNSHGNVESDERQPSAGSSTTQSGASLIVEQGGQASQYESHHASVNDESGSHASDGSPTEASRTGDSSTQQKNGSQASQSQSQSASDSDQPESTRSTGPQSEDSSTHDKIEDQASQAQSQSAGASGRPGSKEAPDTQAKASAALRADDNSSPQDEGQSTGANGKSGSNRGPSSKAGSFPTPETAADQYSPNQSAGVNIPPGSNGRTGSQTGDSFTQEEESGLASPNKSKAHDAQIMISASQQRSPSPTPAPEMGSSYSSGAGGQNSPTNQKTASSMRFKNGTGSDRQYGSAFRKPSSSTESNTSNSTSDSKILPSQGSTTSQSDASIPVESRPNASVLDSSMSSQSDIDDSKNGKQGSSNLSSSPLPQSDDSTNDTEDSGVQSSASSSSSNTGVLTNDKHDSTTQDSSASSQPETNNTVNGGQSSSDKNITSSSQSDASDSTNEKPGSSYHGSLPSSLSGGSTGSNGGNITFDGISPLPSSSSNPGSQNNYKASSQASAEADTNSANNKGVSQSNTNSNSNRKGNWSKSTPDTSSANPSQPELGTSSDPTGDKNAASPEEKLSTPGSTSVSAGTNSTDNEVTTSINQNLSASESNDQCGPLPEEDPLTDPNSVAPLSQVSSVQDYVNNTVHIQNNITAFQEQMVDRLSGKLNDLVATEGYRQPSNGAIIAGTGSVTNLTQVYEGESLESLTAIREQLVTDLYFMEVMLNQTYGHYRQVKDVITNKCKE